MGLTLPNTKSAKIHYLKRINQAHLYEIDLNIKKTLKREPLNLPNTNGAKIHYLKRINQAHLYEIDLNIKKTLKREPLNLPFKGV